MAIAGSLTYETKLDTTGIEKGAKGINTIGIAMGNVLADAFKSASSGVLDLAKNSIQLASDLTEVQNVVDTTFGKDAGKINKWAKEAKNSFGMSELSAKKFNGTMGAMLKSMGLTQDQIYDMSTSMVGLAGDFASFYNLGHEEAFEKIRSGISGETEPLKQLGINMSVANLEAFALSQGIDKTYDSMSQAEQATLRYNYLMSVTKDAQGDFAKTSDSFANQQRILALNFDELSAKIGEKVLPILNDLIIKINSFVSDSDGLLEKIKEIIPYLESIGVIVLSWKIGSTLQAIVKGFQEAKLSLALFSMEAKGVTLAQAALNGTLTVTETIVALLTGKITLMELATGLLSKAQMTLNAVMSANPIMLIVTAVGLLVAGFLYLWNTSEGFRNFWIGLWEGLVKVVSNVVDWIKKNWKSLALMLVNPFAGSFKLLYDNFDGFREFVDNIVNDVKEFFQNLVDSIVTFFTETIPEAISNFVEGVKNFFAELPYYIGYVVGLIIGYIVLFAHKLAEFITVDVPMFIGSVINWFASLPDKIWEFMLQCWEKIKEFGNNLVTFVTVDIPNFINSVVDWFASLPGKIWEWLVKTIEDIKNWFVDLYNTCKEKITKIVDDIGEWFKDLPKKMKDIGKNIVEGIWNGIKGTKDWILGKIKDFGKGLVDGFKKALKIKSPSRVMRDQVGKFIPEGIAVGIDENAKSVMKAINNMNDQMVSEVKKAVVLETGNVNAKAKVSSIVANNSMLQINATFTGEVEMDGDRVGRIITPAITKTLKAGGLK